MTPFIILFFALPVWKLEDTFSVVSKKFNLGWDFYDCHFYAMNLTWSAILATVLTVIIY